MTLSSVAGTAVLPVAASSDRRFLVLALAALLALPLVFGALVAARAPAGQQYGGRPAPTGEYDLYYSFVRQARDGAWTFANLHTTAPYPAVVNLQFLAVGRVGRLTEVSDEVLDHVWRAAGALLLFGSFWRLLGWFVQGRWPRRVALIGFATAGGFGWFFVLLRRAGITLAWDYPIASSGRSGVPFDVFAATPFTLLFASFHLFSFGLLMLAIVLLVRALDGGGRRHAIGAGACGVALALSHPYEAGLMIVTTGLLVAAEWRRGAAVAARLAAVPLVMTGVALGYWVVLRTLSPAFRWHLTFPPASPLHTFVAFGPAALLTLLNLGAFVAAARAGRPAFRVVTCLLVANVALYYSYPLVHFSMAFRTTLIAPLALVACSRLDAWWPRIRALRWGPALVAVALVVNALSPAVAYARRLREAVVPRQGQFLVPTARLEVADWLRRHSAPTDVVLAPPSLGAWLPARTGRSVFVGFRPVVPDWEARRDEVERFYGLTPGSGEDTAGWLRRAGIRYVVVTPDAPEVQAAARPLLVERFRAAGYAVYGVRG